MDSQNILYVYFFQLLVHLPAMIVYLIGIGFSAINASKHPKISILSGIGFVILLITSLFSAALPLLTPYLYNSGNFDAKNIAYIFSFIGLILSILAAVSFALLIGAIWKDRKIAS
jgi:hypothetical protein